MIYVSIFLLTVSIMNCVTFKDMDSSEIKKLSTTINEVNIYFLYEEKDLYLDADRKTELTKETSVGSLKKKAMEEELYSIIRETRLPLKYTSLADSLESNQSPSIRIFFQKKQLKDIGILLKNLIAALTIGIYPASSQEKLLYKFEVMKNKNEVCKVEYHLDYKAYFTWYLVPFWPFYSELKLEKQFLRESILNSLNSCSGKM